MAEHQTAGPQRPGNHRGKKGGFHCLRDSQHALLRTILHRCVCSLQHRLPQPRRRIQPCPWCLHGPPRRPLLILLHGLLPAGLRRGPHVLPAAAAAERGGDGVHVGGEPPGLRGQQHPGPPALPGAGGAGVRAAARRTHALRRRRRPQHLLGLHGARHVVLTRLSPARAHTRWRARKPADMHARTLSCRHQFTCRHSQWPVHPSLCTHTHTHTYSHAHAHRYTHIDTCAQIQTHTLTCRHEFTCTPTRAYSPVHAQMPLQTQAGTHTHHTPLVLTWQSQEQ